MRPEALQVALRPRSSWEAMALGTALVRRHAGAVSCGGVVMAGVNLAGGKRIR